MPGVWTIGFNLGLWQNTHLLKDVGLVPYMFHKVYGFEPGLLGCGPGEYPYREYMPEMRLEVLPEGRDDYHAACMRFLEQTAAAMDLVCLFGAYPFYRQFLAEYRRLRPDGKVYMALDANIHWVDRMVWTSDEFRGILDHCDVIATSSRKLQRHLNAKWNRWVINYIPNGFFNATGREIAPAFDKKENILLTVARIGIDEKAHHILLEAFALAHTALPGWKLRMVGPIKDSFWPYIEEYFGKYPELREKVSFPGLIEDKAALYAEYARAKVFVLSSVVEGGSPNVIAEALFHGCYMVTSNIDACEDITNGGECGRVFEVRDIYALAGIFREICADNALLEAAFGRALTYARNDFDWEIIIKRLHHMLYASGGGRNDAV